MRAITKRTIEEALRLHETKGGGETILKDDEVRGFQVRVRNGRAAYMLYYRASDGTQHRPRIAHYPSISPEVARGIARDMLADVHRGENPSAVRRRNREAPTISELADRYVSEYVSVHNRPSTRKEIERVVGAQLKPKLGATKVTSLTREDVVRFHHSLKSTPYQANRVLSYLCKMLSLAAGDWGLRPDNPAKGIRKFPEKARERFFLEDELRRIGAALDAAQKSERATTGPLNAIRLLALTGCRLGEVLGLKWEDIDFDTGVVRLTETKTGRRAFKLAPLTLAFLTTLKEDAKGLWVVSGRKAQKRLTTSAVESAWKRIRKSADIPGTRLHDFRHTVGTYAGHSGANAFMVRDLLGQKTLAITNRYVGSEEDPLDAMKRRVETRVAAAMSGKQGAVVSFPSESGKSEKGAA